MKKNSKQQLKQAEEEIYKARFFEQFRAALKFNLKKGKDGIDKTD